MRFAPTMRLICQDFLEAPWGALFGALQDRFGVNWMFNSAK
jgi:uncharacterized glyoxalase superfamily protein PhnB